MAVPASSRLLAVYGDSLAMPRVTDGVAYADTYPEVLRAALERADGAPIDLYNRSRGGVTIRTLYEDWANDATYFGPAPSGIAVIQCGIVDCAPRPAPRIVRRGLGAMPGPVQRRAIRFLHDHRSTLLRTGSVWRRTRPTVFSAVLRDWLRQASAQVGSLYVLTIAPTTEAMEAHSPGLAGSIERYNELIAHAVGAAASRHVQLVDVHTEILAQPDGVTRYVNQADGHHITTEGHALYARMLLERELGRHDD